MFCQHELYAVTSRAFTERRKMRKHIALLYLLCIGAHYKNKSPTLNECRAFTIYSIIY